MTDRTDRHVHQAGRVWQPNLLDLESSAPGLDSKVLRPRWASRARLTAHPNFLPAAPVVSERALRGFYNGFLMLPTSGIGSLVMAEQCLQKCARQLSLPDTSATLTAAFIANCLDKRG
jgi:hypothetical protein